MARITLLCLGVIVMLASPLVGAIPGPGGIFVFAAGLILVLRNSLLARRLFVRAKHRWPKLGHVAEHALQRRSFKRRRARDRKSAR
ncbi:hypothetical protein J7S20_06050 [Sphingomonadaceae bacterium LXI357]|uniref:Transmembrane protein (PGPGW) n=1 Tax=Stakelama marina TaxID=2826939 RepID=A0A8T4IBX1_9SPHN|nr:hypothetical protein [Stakelama marina]